MFHLFRQPLYHFVVEIYDRTTGEVSILDGVVQFHKPLLHYGCSFYDEFKQHILDKNPGSEDRVANIVRLQKL